jgi:hypothetical protein
VQLTYKGLDMKQIKKFLSAFNEGIKEKLQNPCRQEAGYKTIEAIIRSCCDDDQIKEVEGRESNTAEVDFNF